MWTAVHVRTQMDRKQTRLGKELWPLMFFVYKFVIVRSEDLMILVGGRNLIEKFWNVYAK